MIGVLLQHVVNNLVQGSGDLSHDLSVLFKVGCSFGALSYELSRLNLEDLPQVRIYVIFLVHCAKFKEPIKQGVEGVLVLAVHGAKVDC